MLFKAEAAHWPQAPLTMDAPLQRSHGEARVSFDCVNGRTELCDLHQSGSAKVRLPNPYGEAAREAVLINTSGGLTDGDTMTTGFEARTGSHAIVTTQACEKVYRAASECDARVTNSISVGPDAKFFWLPQETIIFNKARLHRSLTINLVGDCEFVGLEALLLGRKAMGETVASGSINDRWSIFRDGRVVFADALRLRGDISAIVNRPATLAGRRALATIVCFGRSIESRLNETRRALGDYGSASLVRHLLVARIVADDSLGLRQILNRVLPILCRPLPMPRIWST